MARKHRSRDSVWGNKSLDRAKTATYTCVNCSEPRSPSYHARHPPDEPPPPQGLCRFCVERIRANKSPSPTVIYEVHHHHHTHHYYNDTYTPVRHCPCRGSHDSMPSEAAQSHCDTGGTAELPASPACVELPAEDQRWRLPASHHLFEETPPLAMPWTKPSS